MANTTAVYARIDTQLKEKAESVLSQLGITPSNAIQMLYSQIILTRGLPFVPKLPANMPVAIGDMSEEQISAELMKGFASMKDGQFMSTSEVDEELAREFGI